MRIAHSISPTAAGFSLVEMLVALALLTILTSLAIPLYQTGDVAREARDRRNAQTLCTVYASAQAAGVNALRAGDEKLDVLRNLRQGVQIENGPLRGHTFSCSALSDEDLSAAARYLDLRDNQLIFNSAAEAN